jgi:hypothetical protein
MAHVALFARRFNARVNADAMNRAEKRATVRRRAD